jgi:hypothetical protein
MQTEKITLPNISESSALFDPELPTATDVMSAICCVATQYALNPSVDLARLALRLANNLSAPEYAQSRYIEEVAKKLIMQWDSVLEAFQVIEASVMPQHYSVQ